MRRSFWIIALTGVALLAIALLAFHLHDRSKQEVASRFQDQQLLMALHVANQIESSLRDRSQRVRLLSTLPSSQTQEIEHLKGSIDDYFQYVKAKSVKSISVYDGSGTIIYSTSKSLIGNNDAQAGIFSWARQPENREKVYIGPAFPSSPSGDRPPPSSFLIFKAMQPGDLSPDGLGVDRPITGAISLVVDMKELLSAQLALVNPERKPPQAWIVDANGTLLFHSDHPEMVMRNFHQVAGQCIQCHTSMDYIAKILREKQGIVNYAVGHSSEKLGAFAPVQFENANWIVVVNAPYDDVTAFVRRSFRDTLALLAITIFALVTGSSLVYRDYRSRVRAEGEALQWREKRALEGKVWESEERYRRLVELSPDTIFIQSEGKIVYINAAGLRLFRATTSDLLLGRNVLDLIHPDSRSIVRERIQLLAEAKKIPPLEEKYLRLDGEPVDVEVMAASFPYGGRSAAQVIVREITERKRAETLLRNSEERYRTLFETMHEGFALHEIVCDEGGTPVDYRFLQVNSAFEAMTGLKSGQILGRSVQNVLPGLEGYWIETYGKVARTGEPIKFENYSESLKKHFEVAAYSPRRGQFATIIMDITERKRAEEAILKRSQQLQILSRAAQEVNAVLEIPSIIRSLVATAMDLVGATGGAAGLMADGRLEFTEYNQEGNIIPIEYRFEPGVGIPGWVMEHRRPYISNDAKQDPQVVQEIQKALGFYNLVNVPIQNRRGDLLGVFEIHNTKGRRAFDETDVELLQGLSASAAGALENAQILIERTRAESETAHQKTLFQQLFENAPAAIALLDEHDRILQVNKGFETLFQFSPDELFGKQINETVVSEDFSQEASLLSSRVLHGETVELQSTRCRKDGSLIPVQIYGVPIVIDQRQMGIYGMYVDLSESKRLEEQFRQAQKMEAVGRLAGGVAHDFNNLLTAIMGYSELLLMRFDASDPARKNAEEIKKAGERAASLTRQLLAFSRRQILQPQVMDLNTVVSGMEKLVRRLIGEDVDLRLGLQVPLGNVKADPGQVEQVILNLVVNSRDAMPHGGKLTIETQNIVLQEEYAWKNPGAKPGDYVMLAVSDTGDGMSAEVQSHLFEPFFTTKEKGKGTGLGLSTVYGIVKQSNGYISAESAEGLGTTFRVYLPRVEEMVVNVKTPVVPEEQLAGEETILLVEDEQAIRGLIITMLRMKGYRVLEASNGQEALQIFEGIEDPIDLVITDVVMPKMSGSELASRIVAVTPETKVLFVSGYSEEAVLYEGGFDPGTAFLQKPFSPDSLARKVREVLDQ
ncbi:MAG: PAS domain S-box protein [Terriglobia bacterium]